jgi:hypothetical protein
MADYYTHFTVQFDVGKANVARALEILDELRAKAEENSEPYDDSGFFFEARESDDGLVLDDDTSSDTQGVIHFVLACAKEFGLTGVWGFEYCNTCSKARFDAYGGGAIVINLGTGKWASESSTDILERLSKELA